MAGVQDDFGSSVPPGDYIFRQRGRRLLVASCKAEVADFEIAVLIQQQIARLQVTMDDGRAVDVEAAAQ